MEKPFPHGQCFASSGGIFCTSGDHRLLWITQKGGDFPVFSRLAGQLQYPLSSRHRKNQTARIHLIPRVVKWHQFRWRDDFFGGRRKENPMYLLFGPSMAALIVIAVIQLRDHFVASR
jgi:hypothetical protein